MSDFVVMGISDPYSRTSKIFYTDLREANKINYFETERLRKYTLSCNQTNSNEFVLATELNAKIYDIRQTRPLYQIYEVNHPKTVLRNRQPYIVHAYWSPSGKYIFTINCYANTFFFWDVLNADRIPISMDITRSIEWYGGTTWINDNMVVSSRGDICAITPRSTTMDYMYHSEGSFALDLAYNEKTLQLAGLLDEGICIWSH